MRTTTLALALAALTCGCTRQPEQPVADLVVRNGDVRTMVSGAPRAGGLVVLKGNAYVGNDEDVALWIGPHTKVVDAVGHTVLPGLIDSHIHAAEGALALGGCTLHDEKLIGRDGEIGSLQPGRRADFIVLDRTFGDKTTADEVRVTRPTSVYFAGREVAMD